LYNHTDEEKRKDVIAEVKGTSKEDIRYQVEQAEGQTNSRSF